MHDLLEHTSNKNASLYMPKLLRTVVYSPSHSSRQPTPNSVDQFKVKFNRERSHDTAYEIGSRAAAIKFRTAYSYHQSLLRYLISFKNIYQAYIYTSVASHELNQQQLSFFVEHSQDPFSMRSRSMSQNISHKM